MKVTSTTETTGLLLELLNTHDSIDITEVSTIIGTSCEMLNIIYSNKFIGFNTVNLLITDDRDNPIDSEKLSILQESTTGTIQLQ